MLTLWKTKTILEAYANVRGKADEADFLKLKDFLETYDFEDDEIPAIAEKDGFDGEEPVEAGNGWFIYKYDSPYREYHGWNFVICFDDSDITDEMIEIEARKAAHEAAGWFRYLVEDVKGIGDYVVLDYEDLEKGFFYDEALYAISGNERFHTFGDPGYYHGGTLDDDIGFYESDGNRYDDPEFGWTRFLACHVFRELQFVGDIIDDDVIERIHEGLEDDEDEDGLPTEDENGKETT